MAYLGLCKTSIIELFTVTLFLQKTKGLTGFQMTAQKMKFSVKDFLSKCDQIRRKLRIWSHSLKKALMKNSIFCAVNIPVF